MADDNRPRKVRVPINSNIFMQIKRFYKLKTKKELMEIYQISKTTLNTAIRKIESCENHDATFETLYMRAGRRPKDCTALHTEIRSLLGEDNSLTQIGCRERMQNSSISLSTMCRLVKGAGLSRKRLKRRASVVRTEEHKASRRAFCSQILGMRSRQILFLDESGFNLHTSINYGYSLIGQDAFIYQPKSRGKNVSLCSIIGIGGIEHSMLIDGGCNREIFLDFLEECFRKGIFRNNPVLVMDNVGFHRGDLINNFLITRGAQLLMLPTYSPDLNPIENTFGSIKSNLDRIRPRAETRDALKDNINFIIQNMGACDGHYRNFWSLVNAINNGHEE